MFILDFTRTEILFWSIFVQLFIMHMIITEKSARDTIFNWELLTVGIMPLCLSLSPLMHDFELVPMSRHLYAFTRYVQALDLTFTDEVVTECKKKKKKNSNKSDLGSNNLQLDSTDTAILWRGCENWKSICFFSEQ